MATSTDSAPQYKPPKHTYTPEQIAIKDKLKDELDLPEWAEKDEKLLYRFCRARDFDFEKTADMLSNYINHVEETEIWDDERVEATDEYKSMALYILPKPDKYGRPVMYCRPRFVNPALRKGKENEVEQTFLYWLRKAEKICKQTEQETSVLIFELSGWGMRNRDNATLKMQIDHLQQSYPESLGICFLYNYPWFVWPVWKVAQLWLDPNTAAKVVFLDGKDSSPFTELIDLDDLPTGLGGKLKETDPLIEPWPKSGGGLMSWLGWSKASNDSDTAGAPADDNVDPLAGLTPAERDQKLKELEEEQMAEAEAITKADNAKPKRKPRRRKKKKGGKKRK